MLNSIARSRVRSTRSPAHSHFGHTSRPIALCLLGTAQNNMRCVALARSRRLRYTHRGSYLVLPSSIEFIARYVCAVAVVVAVLAARCRWACSVLIQYKLRVRMANETTAEGDESTALQRGVFLFVSVYCRRVWPKTAIIANYN